MAAESDQTEPRIKVAVLGGGCGAMAAAFYLSSTPELRAHYEVTVYQQGWRLGGKGATGRDPRPGYGDRIYEHGLHMWLGWYHNAFDLIQQVYAEWNKKPNNPYQSWTDAFEAQRSYALQQDIHLPDGSVRWRTRIIRMPKLPGTPGQGVGLLQIIHFLDDLTEWMDNLFQGSGLYEHRNNGLDEALPADPEVEATISRLAGEVDPAGKVSASEGHRFIKSARYAAMRLRQSLEGGETEGAEKPAGAGILSDGDRMATLGLVDRFLTGFQKWLRAPLVSGLTAMGDTIKWYWQFFDFAAAIGLGMARDVIPNGVASINHLNFHDWLVKHGASEGTRWSAFTRAIYDLAFAFDRGRADLQNASYEAGSALMVYLRVAMGYKDAPMFRMQAGMGDTIFSPIYEVLAKQRGVKFEFFKRAKNLALTPDRKQIDAIEFDIQAEVTAGPAAYEPLVDLTFRDGKELPVWPDHPLWDQLNGGAGLKGKMSGPGESFESAWCQLRAGEQRLQRGVDFDLVVLGISVAGVKAITPELSAASPAWQKMVDKLVTVETQAIQLWMNPDTKGLGWPHGATIQTTYAEPIDTWADMSDVLKRETWDPGQAPGSLHYFCGPKECPRDPPIADPAYPSAAFSAVKTESLSWLDQYIGHLWPKAVDANGAMDFSQVHDPENAAGPARFDSQYWRANIDPSDRYVSSQPGTSVFRLKPDESGFTNLFLAGDWTVSSVNGGCVEAAVESGMAASRGICGVPKKIPNYPG